jgi:hypothetical protein
MGNDAHEPERFVRRAGESGFLNPGSSSHPRFTQSRRPTSRTSDRRAARVISPHAPALHVSSCTPRHAHTPARDTHHWPRLWPYHHDGCAPAEPAMPPPCRLWPCHRPCPPCSVPAGDPPIRRPVGYPHPRRRVRHWAWAQVARLLRPPCLRNVTCGPSPCPPRDRSSPPQLHQAPLRLVLLLRHRCPAR